MNSPRKQIDGREFVSLMTTNQRRIFAFILTLVPNINDANDILQETSVTMWEKKDSFEAGTDFVAWGMRIAYFKVLDYRKHVKKNKRFVIADEYLNQLADKAMVESQKETDLFSRVTDCLKKLSPNDRYMVQLRYTAGLPVKDISERFHRSVRMVYSHFARIHGLLMDCLERQY